VLISFYESHIPHPTYGAEQYLKEQRACQDEVQLGGLAPDTSLMAKYVLLNLQYTQKTSSGFFTLLSRDML